MMQPLIRRDLQTIIEFLHENPVQYIATSDAGGKPHCHPIGFCGEDAGRLWFFIDRREQLYRELVMRPLAEICVTSLSMATLRLEGRAVFSDDSRVFERCLDDPFVAAGFQGGKNSMLAVFHLAGMSATMIDSFGQISTMNRRTHAEPFLERARD